MQPADAPGNRWFDSIHLHKEKKPRANGFEVRNAHRNHLLHQEASTTRRPHHQLRQPAQPAPSARPAAARRTKPNGQRLAQQPTRSNRVHRPTTPTHTPRTTKHHHHHLQRRAPQVSHGRRSTSRWTPRTRAHHNGHAPRTRKTQAATPRRHGMATPKATPPTQRPT